MNIKNEIENLLKKSLEELKIDFDGDFNLDHPQDLKNGDYTTNIAMQLAGKAAKNPREIAQQFHAILSKNLPENIENIEIAGAGYLNFYLSKEFFAKTLSEKISTIKTEEKILLEHTSPNLFKPFHIGHMVNNAIGESLVRILKFSGADVITATFPSDVSPGIAKTIWSLKNKKINIEKLQLSEIADAYVLGSKEYKENEKSKIEIDKINTELYEYVNDSEKKSENINFYEAGKNLSLEHFIEITKKLGSHFDYKFFESGAEILGKDLVNKNISKVFQNSNGAVIFERQNSEIGVFINSAGFGTYLAKDIGLLEMKKNKFSNIDKSLVVTDTEQKQHFQMVKESGLQISEISDFVKKSEYLQHGRMNFSGNTKISSRYGNVPLATELIKTVQNNILEKMEGRDFTDSEKKEISEKLAIATLKYSILKVTSGKNISFDIEKDTNPSGNSAPYILYSLVRAKSIFRKIENFKLPESLEKKTKVSNLEKKLSLFNEVLEKVQHNYSPHHLANYIYDLASEFNIFYAETKILDTENIDYEYNLAIVKKYENIVEKGLDLLGIKTVEKM